MTMSSDTDLLHDFLVERNELFDRIESLALSLEIEPANHADLTFLFQAVHTLKSQFGILGFQHFEAVCQSLESELEDVRSARAAVTPACIASALSLVDQARAFFDSV